MPDYDDRRDDDYDDNDDRRDRERPVRRGRPSGKSSTSKVLLVLGGVGCLMVLLCGGCIAAIGIWGFKAFTTQLPPATDAANRFLDELQRGQVDQAYQQTSAKFRRGKSPQQFAEFVKKYEMFEKHTSRNVNHANIFQNAAGTQVIIGMTLQSPNNAMNCTLILVEEGDVWLIDDVKVP